MWWPAGLLCCRVTPIPALLSGTLLQLQLLAAPSPPPHHPQVVVKDVGSAFDPLGFAFLRFLVAAAAFSPFIKVWVVVVVGGGGGGRCCLNLSLGGRQP